MRQLKIYWEQRDIKPVSIDGNEHNLWTTPLSILDQSGPEGRESFIEILTLNYKEELEKELGLLGYKLVKES